MATATQQDLIVLEKKLLERQERLDKKQEEVEKEKASIDKLREEYREKLQKTSGLTIEEAKQELLKETEIFELTNKLNAGLTLLPLRAYTERGFIKVELGLGRSRKKYDKREAIKKRDVERDLRRMKPNEH